MSDTPATPMAGVLKERLHKIKKEILNRLLALTESSGGSEDESGFETFDCPSCGVTYSDSRKLGWYKCDDCDTSFAIARLRASSESSEREPDLDRIAIANGPEWWGYVCNDCGMPWTESHVKHGERQRIRMVAAGSPSSETERGDFAYRCIACGQRESTVEGAVLHELSEFLSCVIGEEAFEHAPAMKMTAPGFVDSIMKAKIAARAPDAETAEGGG